MVCDWASFAAVAALSFEVFVALESVELMCCHITLNLNCRISQTLYNQLRPPVRKLLSPENVNEDILILRLHCFNKITYKKH